MFEASYQTMSMGGHSFPAWEGITSEKFSFAERKHFAPRDMLKKLEAVELPPLGRKHFVPQYGSPLPFRSGLRVFKDNQNCRSPGQHLQIKTKPEFVPISRPYGHREKRHLYPEDSGEWNFSPSIKTFHHIDPKKHVEITVDKVMGRKKLLESLYDQRNLLDVRSLGDKIYKNPEYSPGFFNDGGLITGSTHKSRKAKEFVSILTLQKSDKPKGTLWKDRLRWEEKDEEEKAVKSLFEWEQTNLKDGNPKWIDPDTVEPETPKKQNAKVEQKNAKNPPKK